ncbi:MAG: hypothetical protein ABIH42_03305, partial [Planctomycetota bacterium]
MKHYHSFCLVCLICLCSLYSSCAFFVSLEDKQSAVSRILQIPQDTQSNTNSVQEAFNQLLLKNQKCTSEEIESFIVKSDGEALIVVLKKYIADGSLKAKLLALGILHFLPNNPKKTDLLLYSYITRYNGLIRLQTLTEILYLKNRETVPLFIQTLEEIGFVGKVLGGAEPADLWEFSGEKALSLLFFPDVLEWFDSFLKQAESEGFSTDKLRKELKKEFTQQW